jgi:hypothetical protein
MILSGRKISKEKKGGARVKGKTSSDNGHWIYPGCILTIP